METKNYNDYKNNEGKNSPIFVILFSIIIFVMLFFSIYIMYQIKTNKICKGVYIDEIKVAGLTKEQATNLLSSYVSHHSQDELILIHKDENLSEPFESSISVEQIETKYDIEKAVNEAYALNKSDNLLSNIQNTVMLMFSNKYIPIDFSYNKEILEKNLLDISKNLPDAVIQSSYYIDDDQLVLTKGKAGCVVNMAQMVSNIEFQLSSLNYKRDKIIMQTYTEYPDKLDVEQIYYDEIKEDPQDAYFTTDPYELYPSCDGKDFGYSLEEAIEKYDEAELELSIPLIIVKPEVTTSMLPNEAFPDTLSEFSTNYYNDANRTTNLRLAANKINGTILMPGETFSYNKVVGERTISAGYKNASIYENGAVVDGLGGGICQVTTTLYEACLYANLEIVDRTNHMFVPSYIGAGLDATVVYGLTDYVFKNNRDYPIKIECSVANGVCYFRILGLAHDDDPTVKITTSVSNTSSYTYSTTYKTLYDKAGNQISSEIINKDTYKRH